MSVNISVVENQNSTTIQNALLTGDLASMGGAALMMNLLGRDRIIDIGCWLTPIKVSISLEEALTIKEIVDEKGNFNANIIF